jgi:hypothetical protein
MKKFAAKLILTALILHGGVAICLRAAPEAAVPATTNTVQATPASSATDIERAKHEAERAERREQERLKREQDRAKKETELNSMWATMTVEEKSQVVRLFQGIKELPKEEVKTINDGISQFLKLPPDVREAIRGNYKVWVNMTPQQREAAREEYRQLKRTYEADWKKAHPGEEVPAFAFRIDKDGKVIPPTTPSK